MSEDNLKRTSKEEVITSKEMIKDFKRKFIKQQKVNFDGNLCWFRKIIWKTHFNLSCKVCPLCEERIRDGSEVFLVINNYILFPNIVIHSNCIDGDPDEEVVRKLKKSFEAAKAAYKTATAAWYLEEARK